MATTPNQVLSIYAELARIAKDDPGIAAFLTSGAYSEMSPNAQQLVRRLLASTDFADRPGAFFQAARAASEQQAASDRANGASNTREIHSPTGAPTASGAAAVPGSPAPGAGDGGARGGAREYGPQSGGSAAQAREVAGLPNNGATETAAQAAARTAVEAANAASTAARGSSTTGPSGGGRGTAASMDSQFDPSNGIGDDSFMRFMLQEAGMNPDIMTESSKAAVRGLMPVAKALRNLYGAGNGGVGGGITDFLKGFAQQFTSGGDDFFGNVQKYARDLQGNGNFQTAIGNLKSQEAAQQMYGNLLPLLYAGANPLYGQAASDTFERTVGAYKDADRNSPKPGNTLFTTWLDQQAPQMTPFMRGIFGR